MESFKTKVSFFLIVFFYITSMKPCDFTIHKHMQAKPRELHYPHSRLSSVGFAFDALQAEGFA